ncbi:winged helix-turn-helix transcriptional regulator [Planosporangium thailandense]|uniref:Winged helix-turn-helix transcriptional regulator n=1 Tax=Planosporangium thailandense TaxID=765197 RepID=A0ABX0XT14_9ACTN|nr:winged helix-turn-helix domain-containing protein [Planosporangium thailandense]NJC69135.1 winged helix-turn-helix transcriptional regulator [Planosporangium thailandense]
MPSATPDYMRIADIIEGEIRSGKREPGSKLPTIAELCGQYKVSDNTVKSAFIRLEARGLLHRHQGRGVYVTDPSEWYGRTG